MTGLFGENIENTKRLIKDLSTILNTRKKKESTKINNILKKYKIKSYEEAQELYGYGEISMRQLDTIRNILNNQSAQESEYDDFLEDYIYRLQKELKESEEYIKNKKS